MSDETVKQDAEALADVKKRRGRPRKQKSMENETKESTVETQDMEASAGTQEKKVFKISRTPKIKIKKKDTIPLQGQEEGVDEGPAPEVEGFVHPLEDRKRRRTALRMEGMSPQREGRKATDTSAIRIRRTVRRERIIPWRSILRRTLMLRSFSYPY